MKMRFPMKPERKLDRFPTLERDESRPYSLNLDSWKHRLTSLNAVHSAPFSPILSFPERMHDRRKSA